MSVPSEKGDLFGVSGDSPYYVEIDRLGSDPVIYCAGLGHQIEFEMALARRVGIVIHCFDPTDESARYLRMKMPDGLQFAQVGLYDRDGSVSFAVKKKRAKYYNSVEVKQDHSAGIDEDTFQVRRVGTIMRALGHDRIDLLKIDVEGAEYALLDDMLAGGILPGQIALEWHHSYVGGGDRERGLVITKKYIRKLESLGYRLAYSARDDTEMTLVRDDKAPKTSKQVGARRVEVAMTDIDEQTKIAADVWQGLKQEDKRRAKSHWLGYGRYVKKEDWQAIGEQSLRRLEFLSRILDRDLTSNPANTTIIEWGPGGGSNVVGLSKICSNYIAVDISSSNLGECQKQLSAAGVKTKLHPVIIKGKPSSQLPKEKLPPANLFLSTAVFQHFPSKEYAVDVLRALHAQTAVGAAGFLQIRFDNNNPKYKTIEKLSDYKTNYTTSCSFTIDDFYMLVQRQGFRVQAMSDINTTSNYITYFLTRED